MQPKDGRATGRFNLIGQDLNQQFRVHRMLHAGCLMLIFVNIPWGIYNIINEQWGLLIIRVTLTIAGIVSFVLVRKGKIRSTLILLSILLIIVFCILSIIYDVPMAYTPRTVHIFFLLIGIGCFIGFKDEYYVLSYGFPLVCFVAYVFFASSQWGIVTPYAISPHERVFGAWANNIIALSLIYIIFHVMQSNASKANAMEIELRKAISHNQFTL